MLELIFGLLDVRDGSKRPRRILIVGDLPGPCANFAMLLARIHDFETTVIEVEGTPTSGEIEPVSIELPPPDDPYNVHVPIDCILAEVRRRNWYRGYIWDFFTPHGGMLSDNEEADVTTICNVHLIVYVTPYSEYRTGFCSAVRFFTRNMASVACKFLVVDVSLPLENETLDAAAELSRFTESAEGIRVYKVNLQDEMRSIHLCKSILDEAIGKISQPYTF